MVFQVNRNAMMRFLKISVTSSEKNENKKANSQEKLEKPKLYLVFINLNP